MLRTFLLSMVVVNLLFLQSFTFAVSNDFVIIPEAKSGNKVEKAIQQVTSSGGQVWNNYNNAANTTLKGDVAAQIASGVFTWNTLLDYIVYLIRFLSQIGLVIGALMIIWAGYQYALAALGSGDISGANKAIKNAIYGVLVISFSYAIERILVEAFL